MLYPRSCGYKISEQGLDLWYFSCRASPETRNRVTMMTPWTRPNLLGKGIVAQNEAEMVLLVPLRQRACGAAPGLPSAQQIPRCPFGAVPRSTVATWRVTCTTLTPSSTLPPWTRRLPPGYPLDTTPAITAGSTQYFWPTVRIMG